MEEHKISNEVKKLLERGLQTASFLPRNNILAIITETIADRGRSMQSLLEILSDYGVEEISEYLSEFLVSIIQEAPGWRALRREGIYVANVRQDQRFWKLYLGAQLLNPEVPVLTLEEIYASYRWSRKCKALVVPANVRASVEAWARYQLSLVISRRIYPQLDALNTGVRLWTQVLGHSEDTFLLDRMVRKQRRLARDLEKQERILRTHKAPHCLRRDLLEDIGVANHILEIISR
ncbi:MAG: hypothetical protein QG653_468 [Patescibacteria group bacterium]|nr:hypothetical protein [Patescibacteria group bacterium]